MDVSKQAERCVHRDAREVGRVLKEHVAKRYRLAAANAVERAADLAEVGHYPDVDTLRNMYAPRLERGLALLIATDDVAGSVADIERAVWHRHVAEARADLEDKV